MNYAQFEKEIVLRYRIILEGWTYEKFINPSKLSLSLPGLTKLHNALKSGLCKFVKLSADERKARMEKYQEKLSSEEIQLFQRKRRCDAGVRQKGYKKAKIDGKFGSGNDDNDSGEEEVGPKSTEFVDSDRD